MDGLCPACSHHFEARLLHNGFNASSYCYCLSCGAVAVCSHTKKPSSIDGLEFGPLLSDHAQLLRACTCGGQFHTHAMPRCPSCRAPLNPLEATSWLEAGAQGTNKGWRWQGSWVGLHALVVDENSIADPWIAS